MLKVLVRTISLQPWQRLSTADTLDAAPMLSVSFPLSLGITLEFKN